ncbi:MAG: hypothetical protein LBD17_01590 [Endomicrobium sp.]|nr:hypothetical protein [Endomicrobium sp.]
MIKLSTGLAINLYTQKTCFLTLFDSQITTTLSKKKDIIMIIDKLKNPNELETKVEVLKEAFLDKNADTIRTIFTDYLSRIINKQKFEDEFSFFPFVHLILLALGFETNAEISTSGGRLDLYSGINKHIYAVLEIRHVAKIDKLSKTEENLILANLARENLDADIISHYIAAAVKAKLGPWIVSKLLRQSNEMPKTDALTQKILLNAEELVLNEAERNLAIAKAAREKLNQKEIEEALLKAPKKAEANPTKIYNLLKSATQDALKDINNKGYQHLIKFEVMDIIPLGLSIYGHGTEVYAEFGS